MNEVFIFVFFLEVDDVKIFYVCKLKRFSLKNKFGFDFYA
jgi:hypothetical protein